MNRLFVKFTRHVFFIYFHIWNWREKMNSFHFFFPHLIKWTLPGVVYGELLELKMIWMQQRAYVNFALLKLTKKHTVKFQTLACN